MKSTQAVLSKALAAPAASRGAGGWCARCSTGATSIATPRQRARVGLAHRWPSRCVYAIIAVRLVLFAVAPESHIARRAGSQDAVATARPDILDRNGQILATDVRMPSLFGEPRRIIDVDEATELLTAVLPDLDAARGARAARLQARLRLAQARDQAEAAAGDSPRSAFPASASCPRTSGSTRTAPRSRT